MINRLHQRSFSKKKLLRPKILDQVKKVISPFIDQLDREIQIFEKGGFGYYHTVNSSGLSISELKRYTWQASSSTVNDVYSEVRSLKEKIENHNSMIPELKEKLLKLDKKILTQDFIKLCEGKARAFNENRHVHLHHSHLQIVTNVINSEGILEGDSMSPEMIFWNENRKEFLKVREKEEIKDQIEEVSKFSISIKKQAVELRDEFEKMREDYRVEYNLTEEELKPADLGFI